jgi:hypothetical protein
LLVVFSVLVMLAIPALQAARETSRRMHCVGNLKMIGLAVHSYASYHKIFPPGTICSTKPTGSPGEYDVWGEAAETKHGFHGTSFLLRVRPYLGALRTPTNITRWDYSYGVSGGGNLAIAMKDMHLYCPTRRNGLRTRDSIMMQSAAWTGGGTDYGGCAGRYAAFDLNSGYNLCDPANQYQPTYVPYNDNRSFRNTAANTIGFFGGVNHSNTFASIHDGLANTIMTGELQRITDLKPTSKDGWAIGGPATLFTTGAGFRRDGQALTAVVPKSATDFFNNGFYGSPGSEHAGGANFGLGDASVKFIPATINGNLFSQAGSTSDMIFGFDDPDDG